ncbi:hypothetical protein [Halomicrococcus sp. NG-SE-24]|uniref:hypothetical protein n=1 Tax=Halomicrococcus sp. NG-SE-24 TaxID=3436928 RepID=UPI003D981216
MVDAESRDMVAELHGHLEATAELPVTTEASRWLGEAEAVVGDARRGDPPASVVAKRVEQARDLLSHVEATGSDEADEHVDAARDLVERVLERLDDD